MSSHSSISNNSPVPDEATHDTEQGTGFDVSDDISSNEDSESDSDTSSDSSIPPRADPAELATYYKEESEGIKAFRDAWREELLQLASTRDRAKSPEKKALEANSKVSNKVKVFKSPAPRQKARNAPVAKRGTSFKWSDNARINQTPFRVGQNRSAELKMKLKATDGTTYEFKYSKREVNWKDSKAVSKANTWRRQIFRRRLMKKTDLNAFRPPWTVTEQASIRDTWSAIARKHNAKFQGKTMSVGEALARSTCLRTGQLSRDGQTLQKSASVPLPARTAAAILSMVRRWPEVKSLLENHSETASSQQKDETLSKDEGMNESFETQAGQETDEESEDLEQGSDSESELTDLSDFFDTDDDENIGGNIPGKTTNSGTLVSVY
ncbi:hypothetical protein PVAG01_02803 [Phlyctema vagabunda]|uniref:Uncharacterized protein n=1 Tax=Phlyctema vagabunda TaxID=108571 RepID=A0ABR4PRM8_9HELO